RVRLHRDAVQLRHFKQRAGSKLVAELRLRHRRYFARSVCTPDARVSRRLCDVSKALVSLAHICAARNRARFSRRRKIDPPKYCYSDDECSWLEDICRAYNLISVSSERGGLV